MVAVLFPKGVYRLAFHPSIKKGYWYFGVKCMGCSEPILTLDDQSHGNRKPGILGEGELSIPCYSCGYDAIYAANALSQFQAVSDLPSYRDSRPKSSNSPRQPLCRKYRNAKVTFGLGGLEQRPECAKVIARCVTYWTMVESQLARLLSKLLKANSEPAIAMFLSLRNARAKTDALNATAELTLEPHDHELFKALMQYKDTVEKDRNYLAHGVFGVSAAISNGVAWVSTTDYTAYQALVSGLGLTEASAADFRKKQFVYEMGDLETIALEIEKLDTQIGFFLGYVTSDNVAWRATRYPQLCSEPRLARELDLLRQRQKNKT